MNTKELHEELNTAREWLQSTEACLVDCRERYAETGLEFYRIHIESDLMSIEFWQGQIKTLEEELQKKSADIAPAPPQIPIEIVSTEQVTT